MQKQTKNKLGPAGNTRNMITTNTGTLNRGANKENRWDKLTNH